MEPQSPTPAQTPEPTPTPNPGTAPVQPPSQFGTPQPPSPQPPKKLGTGAIIAIVGGVILLIGLIIGITVAVNAMMSKDDTNSNKSADTSKTDSNEPGKRAPITATEVINLRAVCINGSVENAATFTKPYNYVLFDNNSVYKESIAAREDDSKILPFRDGDEWSPFGTGSSDPTSTLDMKSDPSQYNSVICLDRDDSTAVKTMTCELSRSAGMKDTDSTVADYSSVKYKVTIYEAKTGKKVKDLGTINGPATECPGLKYYNIHAPGIFGDPDIDELNAKLEAFEK